MSKEFYSFAKVLSELKMQEEELKKLVSEGEIRAFRDQDKMKFKKEDVDRFKRGSISEQDTVGEEELPEELVFDEDDADQEVGMATAAITDDAFLEEEDVPLELEEEPPQAAPRTGRRGRPAGGAAPRRPRVVVEEPEETEGPLWAATTILCTVVTLVGAFVVLDAVRGNPTGLTQGIANMARDWFLQ